MLYGKKNCADIIKVMEFKSVSWIFLLLRANHIALKSRELSLAAGRIDENDDKPTIAGCDNGEPETSLPPCSWILPAVRMN